MGKSSSGKDTIYNTLVKDKKLALGTITGYTTRPMRENEMEGREYHFVSEKAMEELENQGKIVEKRCYNTVYGPWYYFTVDDGQIDLDTNNYILIGTLESYNKVRKYYQKENVIPVYIEVEDGERLIRAISLPIWCGITILWESPIRSMRRDRRISARKSSSILIIRERRKSEMLTIKSVS